jgi:DNA gyrase/topoisomerase IV subunit A
MQDIDLIANEDIVITISNQGYIKRQNQLPLGLSAGRRRQERAAAVRKKTILPSIFS